MKVIIIGAGLAGLSAAIRLAEENVGSVLVSLQQSERAQSVLAEGGINAALDTMGEGDNVQNHYKDTMRGGAELADPNAVEGLTKNAPRIVRWLEGLGVPFNMDKGELVLRNFGGQKKKRTAYARSSTGKIIMSAVIDEARKYEAKGLIRRLPHHELIRLLISRDKCTGVLIRDVYTGELKELFGQVIVCSGGLNGMFPEMTTGTTQNSGDCAAVLFSQGVVFSNLEMIQYHPTTIAIPGKRCLISEAARGEGGRLWIMTKEDKPWYFMEEKYPELGNLMPRDVVSREMFFVRRQENTVEEVYLDMTELSDKIWKERLSDLRDEIIRCTGDDPTYTPIPVHEGIHYFMGGIDVDEKHRTSLSGLYAAGECCSQYHGANRLGGNSMLGALYGGQVAAETVLSEETEEVTERAFTGDEPFTEKASPELIRRLRDILISGLGIVRNETLIKGALSELDELSSEREYNSRERARLDFGRAMLISALNRRESRGAHYREDHPSKSERYRKRSLAYMRENELVTELGTIPDRREDDEAET